MKNWSLLIKRVLVAASCVLFSTILNAATLQAYKTNAAEGVDYIANDYFNLLLTANAISEIIIDDEIFLLNSNYLLESNSYAGTLTVGTLLAAEFSDLTYTEVYNPITNELLSYDVGATLIYTGGSLMGSYTGGLLVGNFLADLSQVNATVAEVQAVPVPAAVWLFGSGLLGLAGIARRKKVA